LFGVGVISILSPTFCKKWGACSNPTLFKKERGSNKKRGKVGHFGFCRNSIGIMNDIATKNKPIITKLAPLGLPTITAARPQKQSIRPMTTITTVKIFVSSKIHSPPSEKKLNLIFSLQEVKSLPPYIFLKELFPYLNSQILMN
jgi:hypothetical protein